MSPNSGLYHDAASQYSLACKSPALDNTKYSLYRMGPHPTLPNWTEIGSGTKTIEVEAIPPFSLVDGLFKNRQEFLCVTGWKGAATHLLTFFFVSPLLSPLCPRRC